MRLTRKARRQHERDIQQVRLQAVENEVAAAPPDWVAQRKIETARMNAALRRKNKNNKEN